MVCWTISAGFRLLLRNRPWQPFILCAYVVFVGHVFLGAIIDTDHWRHFFMLLGMVWGGIALEYRYQRGLLPSAPRVAAPRASPRQPTARRVKAVDRAPAMTIDGSRFGA
jgi:hypothetical protein